MKNIPTLLFYCAILYLCCGGLSIAEENKNDKPSENQTHKSSESKNTVHQKIGKRGQIKPLEEFVPSEEVSADKPVAFPNDI